MGKCWLVYINEMVPEICFKITLVLEEWVGIFINPNWSVLKVVNVYIWFFFILYSQVLYTFENFCKFKTEILVWFKIMKSRNVGLNSVGKVSCSCAPFLWNQAEMGLSEQVPRVIGKSVKCNIFLCSIVLNIF